MSLQTLFFENLSPKQTVFKNSFWLFLGQGIGKFFKFFLLLAAARILGPTDFGAFNYLFSIASLFFIFSDWGVSALVIRDYQNDSIDKEKYIRSAAGLKIILVAVAFLAVLAGLLFFQNPVFKTTLILLAVFLVVSNLRDFIVYLFRAFQKMEKEFWLVLAENFSLLVVGLSLLLIYKNIISLSLAYIGSMVVSAALALILFKNYFSYLKPRWPKDELKKLLSNGAPIMFCGLLSFIFFSTDQIILGKLRGTTEVGYYSIATKIILLVNTIATLLMTAVFPYLASQVHNAQKVIKIFKKTLLAFIVLSLFLAVLGMLSAPIIPLIVGSQYGPSVSLFRFFIWIIVFMFPVALFDYILFAYNKQWLNFWFTSACAVINVILNFTLIPRYGMFGAATASIIAQFLNFVISWYLSRKVMANALKSLPATLNL
ncbi:MAG TPA: flippase [Candidatus Paceibacterota bacterium]|nr:flippase [Candidatus Paceibacterota bacterium]